MLLQLAGNRTLPALRLSPTPTRQTLLLLSTDSYCILNYYLSKKFKLIKICKFNHLINTLIFSLKYKFKLESRRKYLSSSPFPGSSALGLLHGLFESPFLAGVF
jgi:hypothetical protein